MSEETPLGEKVAEVAYAAARRIKMLEERCDFIGADVEKDRWRTFYNNLGIQQQLIAEENFMNAYKSINSEGE